MVGVEGFLRMVLVANLVAWPVTWMFMDGLPGGFADRIEMNWTIFVIAGVTALVIEIVTNRGSVVEGGAVEPGGKPAE